MTEILHKLKTMLTGSWKRKVNRRRVSPPETVLPEDYAIIKLKNFDNLPVLIMADKSNGGIAISYDDSHLSETKKLEIKQEINTIISSEFERIQEDANL